MMSPFALRSAQATDLAAVLALPSLSGPDDEIIADVWAAWLHEVAGALVVATVDDAVVGAIHCAQLSPDEGWLEALRIAPELRDRGLATALVRAATLWAQAHGLVSVRASAGSADATMGTLLTGSGFAQVASYVRFAAPVVGARPDAFAAPRIRQPGPEELDRLWAWLESSNLVSLTGGLYLAGDRAAALTDAALEAFLSAGEVWTLEDHAQVQSLVIAGAYALNSHETRLALRYLDGASQGISQLALHLRARAAGEGDRYSIVEARPIDLLILHDALNGAGFTRADDAVQWVYAKNLG
ncbi:MAG: GNAT family N-acetyltransferase [Ktedonobacterales bacterium]|nr:GNAT family N-acetyltransferase [Ktedonobacterales bacterium]